MKYRSLNHITISAPANSHDKVRWFYGSVMGFEEVPYPEALKGIYDLVWFKLLDILLHVDLTPPFVKTSENRHYALEVEGIDELRKKYESYGADIREAVDIPDRKRFYIVDPFGNYIEIIEFKRE